MSNTIKRMLLLPGWLRRTLSQTFCRHDWELLRFTKFGELSEGESAFGENVVEVQWCLKCGDNRLITDLCRLL